MKALATIPGSGKMEIIERPEPVITAPDEVKMKVLEVGICGTDREEASGGRADAPTGEKELVIGHEMFGQVTETGANVSKVKVGDYGVFMVRRPCGVCVPCKNERSDMCETGNYTERGIKGRDGYQSEFVVDQEKFLVKVPEIIKHLGVLTEPTTVSEKAIDEAVRIQAARLPETDPATYLQGKQTLVVGLGPIGLLAAVVLRLRGANVLGMDIQDENTIRPTLLKQLGGHYIDGRQVKADKIDDAFGQIDMILEATGVAELEFELLDALGINGIYVLTGIPAGDRPMSDATGSSLMQKMVLKNQVMFGSVNASIHHFQMAIDDLEAGNQKFPDIMKQIITDRHPYTEFQDALFRHGPNEIKCVLDWA